MKLIEEIMLRMRRILKLFELSSEAFRLVFVE
jgi:hypothetical protein